MIRRHKNGQFVKGSQTWLGKKLSIAHRKKLSKIKKNTGIIPPSRMGCTPWNKGLKNIYVGYWKGKKRPEMIGNRWGVFSGEKNHHWKGDTITYGGLHAWVRKKFGALLKCEVCGTIEKKKYHWAMRHNTFSRKRKDWFRLCVSCHKKYDLGKIKIR